MTRYCPATAVQRTISSKWPDMWNAILNQSPEWAGLGGSIFHAIAVNYHTQCFLHRDESDHQMAWIYYFDQFKGGELQIPELLIKVPVKSLSLCGMDGRSLYHSAGDYTGNRSCITFYCHYKKGSAASNITTFSDTVSWLQTKLNWKSH